MSVEPNIPPVSANDPIWGVRNQPSGTLGAVNLIQRLADIGTYLQWLKSVDNDTQTSLNTLAADIYDLASTVAALQSTVNGLAGSITIPSWQSYTPMLVVNDGTATSAPTSGTNPTLGTGSVQLGRYFQLGSSVIANFVIQFGTSNVNAGSGAYRVTLPVPCTGTANSNRFVLGSGHLLNHTDVYDLGPGNYRAVNFHTSSVISTYTAGIVIGSNLPAPNGGGAYRFRDSSGNSPTATPPA